MRKWTAQAPQVSQTILQAPMQVIRQPRSNYNHGHIHTRLGNHQVATKRMPPMVVTKIMLRYGMLARRESKFSKTRLLHPLVPLDHRTRDVL